MAKTINKKYKNIKDKLKKYAVPAEEVFKRYKKDVEHRRVINAKAKYYEALMELRSVREERKLTQEQLSKKSGVPRATISKIETGSRNVTINTLISLASAMGKRLEIRLV